MLSSGNRCYIRANSCIPAKVVVVGQKWMYSGKMVVFGKKWL